MFSLVAGAKPGIGQYGSNRHPQPAQKAAAILAGSTPLRASACAFTKRLRTAKPQNTHATILWDGLVSESRSRGRCCLKRRSLINPHAFGGGSLSPAKPVSFALHCAHTLACGFPEYSRRDRTGLHLCR